MNERKCLGPVHRRQFLQAGLLALGGVGLPELLRARAATHESGRRGSVILLYMHGGPSHLETYDLKPEAPVEYRSIFKPIATNVPGLSICEHLPLQARIADKFSLIRSCHHSMSSHSDGGIEVLTGKTPSKPDATSTSRSDHPDLGSVASRVRGIEAHGLPQYVSIPTPLYMTRPAYLGMPHQAFSAGDPGLPTYSPPSIRLVGGVDDKRLTDRRGLREQFDHLRAEFDATGKMAGADEFRGVAYQLLTSSKTSDAFDLSRESDKLRHRYGRDRWGQSCLLARRLAEAGVAVTTVYINTPKDGDEFTNWDDHIMNAMRPGHFGKYMETRFKYYDRALSSLIEDVYDRGLDKDVMVVALGEFGRTPRLSHSTQGTGRDHWPDAQSILVSGGGLQMGQVIGATNAKGEYPVQRACTPKDVLATIYRHLGIDPGYEFRDHTGRPIPILNEGKPIDELI